MAVVFQVPVQCRADGDAIGAAKMNLVTDAFNLEGIVRTFGRDQFQYETVGVFRQQAFYDSHGRGLRTVARNRNLAAED